MNQTKTGPVFRIVKDELTDGRGYRLTFELKPINEPDRPLLPLDPSDPKYLQIIAGMTKKKLEKDDPREPLFVYATDEGVGVIQDMGTKWVLEKLFAVHGASERKAEERLIAGNKACSLLRISRTEKEPHTSRLLSKEAEVVDYLKRFGVTRRVSSVLQNIAAQMTTCKLEPALVEYVAGKDFLLREYRTGMTLEEIKTQVDDLAHEQDMGPYGRTKRQWQHWFDQFGDEMAYVRELFFIVGFEKGEPYTQADFSLQSWLCSGIDEKSGRPQLTLVDQRPNLLGTPDSVMDTDDMVRSVRYRELMSRHRDNGVLALLRK